MEVVGTTRIASNSSVFSTVPIFASKKFPIVTEKKNPLRRSINSSFTLHLPFSCYSRTSSRNFRVWAHFGRPSIRPNHLRRKLTEQQEQVLRRSVTHEPDSGFQHPVHKLGDNDNFHSQSDSADVKATSCSANSVVSSVPEESKSKLLWNKLENWVDQYSKDVEIWGIGSGHIFTVFQDSHGKVKRVVVDESEILRRGQIHPSQFQSELEDLTEIHSKIAYAKGLAREMESGNNLLPKNSSVVKFVCPDERSRFLHAIRDVSLRPDSFSKASRVGIMVFSGYLLIWVVNRVFTADKDVEYSRLEKEILGRKVKARRAKENLAKGSVEVIQESEEKEFTSMQSPQIDKQAVVDNILKSTASTVRLTLPEKSGTQASESNDFDRKIEEVRAMARQVRVLRKEDHLANNDDRNKNSDGLSSEEKVTQQHGDDCVHFSNDVSYEHSSQNGCLSQSPELASDVGGREVTGFINNMAFHRTGDGQTSSAPDNQDLNNNACSTRDAINEECGLNSFHGGEASQLDDDSPGQSGKCIGEPAKAKPKVILSIREAREFLDKKREKRKQEYKLGGVHQFDDVLSSNMMEMEADGIKNQRFYKNENDFIPSTSGRTLDYKGVSEFCEDPVILQETCGMDKSTPSMSMLSKEENRDMCDPLSYDEEVFRQPVEVGSLDGSTTLISCEKSSTFDGTISSENCHPAGVGEEIGSIDDPEVETSMSHKHDIRKDDIVLPEDKSRWIEKNYHEFEPIVGKIRVGFRDNYSSAKLSKNEELNMDTLQLKSDEDADELDWMKDDKLREIVFQVRENELAGRDPFFQMKDGDKVAFFNGLDKKVEVENKKLIKLHEYLHSNIENLDYGADGISLYDQPEKIIPRWKGPSIEKNPEFLNNFVDQRKEVVEKARDSLLGKNDRQLAFQESKGSQTGYGFSVTTPVNDQHAKIQYKAPKTIIEGSDGSLRAGKKSGKEYWEHTKKWSQGFLESYNAEPDPEIKATMKDIGKDLDRWITEKEIQEAATVMDKIPERGKKFIEEKLNKMRREMELFGPQAVVSKYREYADEDEDYLWWLDLPFVLCIELYMEGEGKQKIGFYSLEMAADLELEPKPCHVIAFEDAGDCKNLCYIIQAHMEMLGSGNAFVVARPPKDAFWEVKANGFDVTVIRKGELQLNIDQMLEEVEEQIIDIGSKIYHDQITREHSVDISSIMKGVFGVSKPNKRRRRSKRKLKKPSKRH